MSKVAVRSVSRFLRNSFRVHRGQNQPPAAPPAEEPAVVPGDAYEILYETHARIFQDETSVGDGNYHVIGLTEFELLLMEGLQPGDTLVDFGCGNGRLAVHVVPYLDSRGTYVGIDISETYLQRAEQNIHLAAPQRRCQVKLLHQNSPEFPLPDRSVDMVCAFSVFTHMEHEDNYRYLKAVLRICKPGGKFIFSCLPLNLKGSQSIFLNEAEMDLATRWKRVRNVCTSKDMITTVAEMAGWKVVGWYEGDQENIGLPNGPKRALGQSSCILQAP